MTSLPVPDGIGLIICLPEVEIDTGKARALLRPEVPLETAVEHARRICAFTLGCERGDRDLIRAGLEDILIEPQRLPLLPELANVKSAARGAGALGCSFSGSGPAVFAWADEAGCEPVLLAMTAEFEKVGRSVQTWISPLYSSGAQVEAVS